MGSARDLSNPFGVPEFLDLWWECFCARSVPLRDDTLSPYLRRSFRELRFHGLVGVIEACGIPPADYTDLDWNMTSEADIQNLLDYFLDDRDLHLLIVPRVRETSPLAVCLSRLSSVRPLVLRTWGVGVAPCIYIESDWERYYGLKGRKFRYNLRRAERKLAEIGPLSFRHITEPEEVGTHLDSVLAILAKRSSQRRRNVIWLTRPGQKLFHGLAITFSKRGWFDLALLIVGDTPIAFCYGFRVGLTYYYYVAAIDPSAATSQYSPGLLLIRHLIQLAFDQGLHRFDFMLGDEPYKEHWATDRVTLHTYVLSKSSSLRSRMACSVYRRYFSARRGFRPFTSLSASVGGFPSINGDLPAGI